MATIKIDEWIVKNGKSLDILSESEQMSYPYPKTIDDVDELFSKIIFKPPRRSSNRLYLGHLQNVYIFDNEIIFDNTLKNQVEGFEGPPRHTDNSVCIENGIHLSSKWGDTNYWHWMSESLARLSLLNNIPDNAKYIVNSLKNNFVLESLETMGIKAEKCLETNKAKSIFCYNLFLPSKMGDFDKKGLIFLRGKIKSAISSPKDLTKRIYISRRNTRVVINESEVFDLLSKYGFVMVKCEELSFEEQVKMFYNAEVVVAPHGAGNTNLLFAKDNAKLLELRSPKYFGRTYYYLCNHLGFDYWSLYGIGKIPTTPQEVGANLQSNMNIDISRLKKSLEFMGVK